MVNMKVIFTAMMYAAREQGVEVDAKFYELEDELNGDYSIEDVIDNLESVYKMAKEDTRR